MCKETKTDKPIWQIKKEEAKARKAEAAKHSYDRLVVEDKEALRNCLNTIANSIGEIEPVISKLASAVSVLNSLILFEKVDETK